MAIQANPIEFHSWGVCNLDPRTTSVVGFVSQAQQRPGKRPAIATSRLQRINKHEKVSSIMGMITDWPQPETGFVQRH